MNEDKLFIMGSKSDLQKAGLYLMENGYTFTFIAGCPCIEFEIGYIDVDQLKEDLKDLGLGYEVVTKRSIKY